jgi:hypothetical protein
MNGTDKYFVIGLPFVFLDEAIRRDFDNNLEHATRTSSIQKRTAKYAGLISRIIRIGILGRSAAALPALSPQPLEHGRLDPENVP